MFLTLWTKICNFILLDTKSLTFECGFLGHYILMFLLFWRPYWWYGISGLSEQMMIKTCCVTGLQWINDEISPTCWDCFDKTPTLSSSNQQTSMTYFVKATCSCLVPLTHWSLALTWHQFHSKCSRCYWNIFLNNRFKITATCLWGQWADARYCPSDLKAKELFWLIVYSVHCLCCKFC